MGDGLILNINGFPDCRKVMEQAPDFSAFRAVFPALIVAESRRQQKQHRASQVAPFLG
jgi:hypothetical protein